MLHRYSPGAGPGPLRWAPRHHFTLRISTPFRLAGEQELSLALAELGGISGRGARLMVPVTGGEALVIDESYNANPASMRATLEVLAHENGRRLAVLGEMRELGEHSEAFHAELSGPVEAAGVAYAILVGPAMEPLANALEGRVDFVHVPDAAEARDRLDAVLAPGDAVLIKGSNGVRLSSVVAALAERQPCST